MFLLKNIVKLNFNSIKVLFYLHFFIITLKVYEIIIFNLENTSLLNTLHIFLLLNYTAYLSGRQHEAVVVTHLCGRAYAKLPPIKL